MAKKKAVQRGKDLAGAGMDIEYLGKSYNLVLTNKASLITEQVYEEEFGKDIGFYAILGELQIPKHRALMAFIYGMLKANGVDTDWNEFMENFTITDIRTVAETIARLVTENMPKAEETDDENPTKTGTMSSPGVG